MAPLKCLKRTSDGCWGFLVFFSKRWAPLLASVCSAVDVRMVGDSVGERLEWSGVTGGCGSFGPCLGPWMHVLLWELSQLVLVQVMILQEVFSSHLNPSWSFCVGCEIASLLLTGFNGALPYWQSLPPTLAPSLLHVCKLTYSQTWGKYILFPLLRGEADSLRNCLSANNSVCIWVIGGIFLSCMWKLNLRSPSTRWELLPSKCTSTCSLSCAPGAFQIQPLPLLWTESEARCDRTKGKCACKGRKSPAPQLIKCSGMQPKEWNTGLIVTFSHLLASPPFLENMVGRCPKRTLYCAPVGGWGAVSSPPHPPFFHIPVQIDREISQRCFLLSGNVLQKGN